MKYEAWYIEWLDAHRKTNSWEDIKEVIEYGKVDFCVRELGFIIEENEHYLLLAPRLANFSDEVDVLCADAIKISVGWIRKRKKIEL